jgi:hypothetical protein
MDAPCLVGPASSISLSPSRTSPHRHGLVDVTDGLASFRRPFPSATSHLAQYDRQAVLSARRVWSSAVLAREMTRLPVAPRP